METQEARWRAAIEGFPATWRRIVTDPHGFLAEMPETGGLGHPTAFLVVAAAANALGHLIVGTGLAGSLWVLVGQVLGGFLAAAVFVLIAQHLFDGRAGFEPTFRVVAYAAAPLVIFWVPMLGWIAWSYSAYLIVRGLERVQGVDTVRAVLTLVLGLGVLWLAGRARAGGPVWF
jgi:hypothetical protein